ncbi:MAG: hypothetical protein RR800_09815, partial [Comamonas sp.]
YALCAMGGGRQLRCAAALARRPAAVACLFKHFVQLLELSKQELAAHVSLSLGIDFITRTMNHQRYTL